MSALFTTKSGGASKGIYAESNFSFTRGDEQEAVEVNYKLAVEALCGAREDALTAADCVLTYQTHSANVLQVTRKDAGKGVTRNRDYIDVDGLITDERGLI